MKPRSCLLSMRERITRDAWLGRLADVAGRCLTIDEQVEADRLNGKGLAMTSVAEALFGEEAVRAANLRRARQPVEAKDQP